MTFVNGKIEWSIKMNPHCTLDNTPGPNFSFVSIANIGRPLTDPSTIFDPIQLLLSGYNNYRIKKAETEVIHIYFKKLNFVTRFKIQALRKINGYYSQWCDRL